MQRLLITGGPLFIQFGMACVDEFAAWLLSSSIVADRAECGPVEAQSAVMDLVDRFGQIADPGQARWVEHPLPAVLALCAGAVVAGNSSFTAIAGWIADVPLDLPAMVYSRRGGGDTLPPASSKSTIWRLVTKIDSSQADAAIGAWLLERAEQSSLGKEKPADDESPRPVELALDGKTLKGAQDSEGNQIHLLAVMTHSGLVAGQVEVGAKTNEIPMLPVLLDGLDITGAVITADALHTQRDTAEYLYRRGADFCFCVKENQPKPFAALNALPWNDTPISHTQTDRGHGRIQRRTIRVLPAPNDLPFPHLNQVTLIERYVSELDGTPRSAVAALGITSLPAPAQTRHAWPT